MDRFLKKHLGKEQAGKVVKLWEKCLDQMEAEQKFELTNTQYKIARDEILPRIALYLSLLALPLVKVEAQKLAIMRFDESVQKRQRKLCGKEKMPGYVHYFERSLNGKLQDDIWLERTVKKMDATKKVTVQRCLYYDLCEYYNCPELCVVFCDGEQKVFKGMKKIKMEWALCQGLGDKNCTFEFRKV